MSTSFYNNVFVDWVFQTPVTINTDDQANRMERSHLVIVVLFTRKLQHKHTIKKLSSWLEEGFN